MRYGTAARWILTGLMSLLAPVVAAEDAKVSPLMAKDLAGLTGKEGVMLTVEYAPAHRPSTGTTRTRSSTSWRAR